MAPFRIRRMLLKARAAQSRHKSEQGSGEQRSEGKRQPTNQQCRQQRGTSGVLGSKGEPIRQELGGLTRPPLREIGGELLVIQFRGGAGGEAFGLLVLDMAAEFGD